MNTILIMMICGSVRCDFTPQYAVVFATEAECMKEVAKHPNVNSIYKPKYICVPEVKIAK